MPSFTVIYDAPAPRRDVSLTATGKSATVTSRQQLLELATSLAREHVATHPNLYGLFNADATNGEKLRDVMNREAIDIVNGLWGKQTPVWHRSRCAGEIMMMEDGND